MPDTRTYADNVQGTFNVFQACADLGIGRVISASSGQVHGFRERARHAFGYEPGYAWTVDERCPEP